MLLAMLSERSIGFFGQQGPLWFFLGLLFLVIVLVILWKISAAVMAGLKVPAPWDQVIYWVFVLICVLVFWNYAVGHWW